MFCIAQNKQFEVLADTTLLAEVIVTATKNKTDIRNIPYSVNKIAQDKIADFSYRTVPEALMGATGVFIQKTNHGGGSPFIRGLTGNQTLLLVDGIRLNNATFRYGPNQYLNTIDVYNLASIEIARGTGSVQYGSDAMGGVVQVFTKDPLFTEKASWHSSIYGKIVSDDIAYVGRGELLYQSPKLAIQVGGTSKKFGDLLGGDTTGMQSPSGYTEKSFDVKLRWKIAKNAMLTLSHQSLIQKDVPLFHKVVLENYAYYFFSPQQHNLSFAKLEMVGKSKLINKLTLISSYQQSKEVRTYQKNGNVNRFEERDKVNTVGFNVELFSVLSHKWTVNSGIEYYHDLVESSKLQTTIASGFQQLQRGLYPNEATSGNSSVYSLHHISFNKFQVDAGIRFNSFAIAIKDTATSAVSLGNAIVKPASLVSNFSLLYNLTKHSSLYGSFSTGYRAPNIDDMGTLGLVDFRYEVPAYGLKPEKSYNTEIGYRLVHANMKASVAVFYMHLTDLITRVQVAGQQVAGYNVYVKENSQESFLRGVEYDFNCSLSKHFSIESGAAYTFGQNLSRNEPMRRVPPFNGRMLLQYTQNDFHVKLENLFASKQSRLAQGDFDDNRIAIGGTPGWYLLNIYAGYQIANIIIRTGLMNVFNEDYRTHGSGINGAGRNIYCSIQFKL